MNEQKKAQLQMRELRAANTRREQALREQRERLTPSEIKRVLAVILAVIGVLAGLWIWSENTQQQAREDEEAREFSVRMQAVGRYRNCLYVHRHRGWDPVDAEFECLAEVEDDWRRAMEVWQQ